MADAFEEHHAKLVAEQKTGADPEDPDEYRAQSILWVPLEARWAHLKAQARQPTRAPGRISTTRCGRSSRVPCARGRGGHLAAAGLEKPEISILSDEFRCAACRSATSPLSYFRSS